MTPDTGILRPSKDGTPPAEHTKGHTTIFTRFTTLIAATLLAATVVTSAQAAVTENGLDSTNGLHSSNGWTGNNGLDSSNGLLGSNGRDQGAHHGHIIMIELPKE